LDQKLTPIRLRSQPLYLQTIEALHDLLERQVFRPGDALPREDVLAKQLGISRLTLREALGYLESDGIIERRRGVGTFVTEPTRSHIWGGLERLESVRSLARVAGMDAESVNRQFTTIQATPDWADKLAVAAGSELARVSVIQAIGGVRIGLFDSVIPTGYVVLEDLQGHCGTLLEYLLQRGDVFPCTTRTEIYAINADERLSALLGSRLDQSLLHLVETYYTGEGQPIALSLNYFLTDHFNFYINRRVVGRPRRIETSP
jgi:GntR family transcriptional regulator